MNLIRYIAFAVNPQLADPHLCFPVPVDQTDGFGGLLQRRIGLAIGAVPFIYGFPLIFAGLLFQRPVGGFNIKADVDTADQLAFRRLNSDPSGIFILLNPFGFIIPVQHALDGFFLVLGGGSEGTDGGKIRCGVSLLLCGFGAPGGQYHRETQQQRSEQDEKRPAGMAGRTV